MDSTFNIHRPITPPSDRKQNIIQNNTEVPYLEREGEETSLSDLPYLNKQKVNTNDLPPASTAPSVPSRTAASFSPSGDSANPFLSHTEPQNKSLLSDTPIDSTIRNASKSYDHNAHNESTMPSTRELHDQDIHNRSNFAASRDLQDKDNHSTIPTTRELHDQDMQNRSANFAAPRELRDQDTQSRSSNFATSRGLHDRDTHTESAIPTTRKLHDQDQDIDHLSKKQFSNRDDNTSGQTRTYQGGSLRTDTTHRIESEVLSILQWRNPVRSGAIFGLVVGSIIMTRWYSLLQISSSLLTLAIGINLVYVNLVLQSQKVLTNQDASHPYSDVIYNDHRSMIDRKNVRHYSTVMTEVSETVIRALTRIVFIENTGTSLKWMSIFFVIWKVSAHVSTMDIVLGLVISAFIFPRLYISNKDIVDAQLHKGQNILQSGINQAQSVASNAVHDTYKKSRAFVAKAGTTGTDAKNTLSNTSVTVKED